MSAYKSQRPNLVLVHGPMLFSISYTLFLFYFTFGDPTLRFATQYDEHYLIIELY